MRTHADRLARLDAALYELHAAVRDLAAISGRDALRALTFGRVLDALDRGAWCDLNLVADFPAQAYTASNDLADARAERDEARAEVERLRSAGAVGDLNSLLGAKVRRRSADSTGESRDAKTVLDWLVGRGVIAATDRATAKIRTCRYSYDQRAAGACSWMVEGCDADVLGFDSLRATARSVRAGTASTEHRHGACEVSA